MLTKKQRQIISVVVRANPDGSFLDINQIMAELSYHPSKESLQFSLRALINKGLIEKQRQRRRGYQRLIIAPTLAGYAAQRAQSPLSPPCLP
jgi:hypothetical protein